MDASMPAPLPDDPMVVELVRVIRAQDTHGVWDGIADAELIAPFVLTRERRDALPLIADPSPKDIWRVEMFYAAVALVIERRTGHAVAPVMSLHPEGWGRLVLIVGRLVAVSLSLRDVHRFGFPSLEKLAEKGNRLVDDAAATINRFPDAATA